MGLRYVKTETGLAAEAVEVVEVGGMQVRRVRRVALTELNPTERILEQVLEVGEVAIEKVDSRGRPGFVVVKPGQKDPTWLTITEKK
jgi:hypothetical protein